VAGKPRVLVTRPEPGASETARRLEAMGFLSLKLPLQEIRPLKVGADAIPADVAAVAVTSANAIRHTPSNVVGRLKHLPCFAVGASTAAAAADAGFSDVIEGRGDAEALAETIIGRRPGGSVAYLCGKVRRVAFENRLAAEGVPIHAVETYDTIGVSYTVEEVQSLTARHAIDYVLVYSANAAGALVAVTRQTGLEDLFENTIFACISGRVAETFDGRPQTRIRIAPEPDERMLLSLLGPGSTP
jgi:uroporphyrinogen-III synthase